MTTYRFYFLTGADHIVDVVFIDCESDDKAEQAALALVPRAPYGRVEVWDRERRIGFYCRRRDTGEIPRIGIWCDPKPAY